jgi:hypothetical protein
MIYTVIGTFPSGQRFAATWEAEAVEAAEDAATGQFELLTIAAVVEGDVLDQIAERP